MRTLDGRELVPGWQPGDIDGDRLFPGYLGMVHRHFGTRDDLIDRLLERIAARWTVQTQATGDFGAAIESILGPTDDAATSAGSWIRLLAWSLLTDDGRRSGDSQRRYATLDLLPGMLPHDDPDEAAHITAAALALVFGWRFFHPYIRAALHLEDDDFAEIHASMARLVQRLLA